MTNVHLANDNNHTFQGGENLNNHQIVRIRDYTKSSKDLLTSSHVIFTCQQGIDIRANYLKLTNNPHTQKSGN